MIYRLDLDLNGTETIDHLIKAGLVENIECRTFKEYDKAVQALGSKVKPDDMVIVDTINRAVDLFLHWQFITLRLKPGQSMSDLDDVKNPPNTLQVYGQAKHYVVEPLRGLPCPLVILSQEAEKFFNAENGKVVKWTGEMLTANIPNALPPEGLVQGAGARLPGSTHEALMDMTSDVFRVGRLMEDKNDLNNKGETVKYKAGTRVLNVSDTVACLAKVHVQIEQYRKLRDNLYSPTLPKIYNMLGLKPRVILFYGPQGVGKTTLACSVAEAEYKSKLPKTVETAK
jgi:hypothetical protein